MAPRNVRVGAIKDVSGEVNIAAGDIYKGYTPEQVNVLLTQITATFQPKPFDGRCPYKGLDVFEEEDADLFFGRERLVEDLISRVKESRTVFITGPSGSGKSSLVRAGLIHALKQGATKGLHSENWKYEIIKPGRDPMEALALAFSRLKSPELADYFRQHAAETNTLNKCAESILSERQDQRFVLFVDQFEEVFTQLSKDNAESFINLLTHAATVESGRVIILFSMRSDFVSNCALYPQLNTLLNQQFVQIGGMQPNELVSAIAQPALRVGLRVDPDLIAQIINDMEGEPGALPLMQFALKDLFDSEQGKDDLIAFTLNEYLQHGGIRKSLERHADASFAKLNKHEQELARSIFTGLIETGQGTQDTSRTALFDELVPADAETTDVETVVQKLADARLVTTDEQAGRDTVMLAHEKLIDTWPWLKKLVNENRGAIALHNEITSDAKQWDDNQQEASYLYSGARLANVREQLMARKLVLSGLAEAFIEAGVKAYTSELEAARQTATQLRRRALYLAVALFVALAAVAAAGFFGVQALVQANEAQHQAKIALGRQLAAQAHAIFTTGNSNQITAVLLAIESMQRYPSVDAAQVLQNNTLAHQIARMTHQDYVASVAFSPDGKYVASGSWDDTARVWEIATGREISRMTHDDKVTSVAFSPNGKYVVSVGDNIRVWEAATGREIARMTYDSYIMTSVAFSPDGKYVVLGGYDKAAHIWDITTSREIAHMNHDAPVTSVAFSPDGKYIVSGSDDGTARVWDIATTREIARMIHDGGVTSVAFSPDGKYVVSGSADNTARVWEAVTGRELARLTHESRVTSVAFSPDGQYVVSGSDDNTARVWELTTGKEVARMTHSGGVTAVAFSPDGQYVVSGSWGDFTARVWETTTGQEIARMTHDGFLSSIAFSPDGKYVVSGGDVTVRVWEATQKNAIASMTHESSVTSVAFSPDGKYVVSGSNDHTARVWETATGKEIARMTNGGSVSSLAFSPDGKYLVSGSDDGTARVWDIATTREIARMIHDDGVTSVAFSPNGKYVVSSGGFDGTARVWETTTGKEIAHMTYDTDRWILASVAFSPDGHYVVSGLWNPSVSSLTSKDFNIRIWEAATGNEVLRMNYESKVVSVAFSPDGKYVASGSWIDDTVRVWEISTGKEIARMTHENNVTSVAFSPDGQYLVSGSWDGTVRVWETSTGKELLRMAHNGIVNSVAFSPDGQYIVSGSDDNIARVWMWRSKDLIEYACSRLTRNLTSVEWKIYLPDEPYRKTCPQLPGD